MGVQYEKWLNTFRLVITCSSSRQQQHSTQRLSNPISSWGCVFIRAVVRVCPCDVWESLSCRQGVIHVCVSLSMLWHMQPLHEGSSMHYVHQLLLWSKLSVCSEDGCKWTMCAGETDSFAYWKQFSNHWISHHAGKKCPKMRPETLKVKSFIGFRTRKKDPSVLPLLNTK